MTKAFTPSKILISVRDLELSFSRHRGLLRRNRPPVLKGVSFDIYHGETLAIVGRNGAGKSVLMKLLAGILAPDSGSIEMHGDIRTSLLSLRLGFINYLSGRENARLSGLLLGISRKDIEAKMDEIIEFSELGEAFDDPIGTYSSGMTARLSFSVAFVASPDVLLVDEVWGVGDAAFQRKSRSRMEVLMRSDKTIILVSHSDAVVRDLATRAVWLDEGVIKHQGEPAEVVDYYLGKVLPG